MFGSEKNKCYKFVNCSDMGPQGILTTCISVKPGQTRGKRLKNFQSIEFCNPCLRSNQSPNLQTAEELFIPTDDFLQGALRLDHFIPLPLDASAKFDPSAPSSGMVCNLCKKTWHQLMTELPRGHTTCRVSVGWWWIENWRNYNGWATRACPLGLNFLYGVYYWLLNPHIQWPFQEPIDWRYLPYIRSKNLSYVPPIIYPLFHNILP